MKSSNERRTSPLSVASRPPSLVVDRFSYPTNEKDLRLAASVHLADDPANRAEIDAKLAAAQRELDEAAKALTCSSAR